MNQSELYSKASGKIKDEVDEEVEQASEAFDIIAWRDWNSLVVTKEFFLKLQNDYYELIESASNLANAGNNKAASRKLIKANTIKEIIEYGRRDKR